MPLTNSYKYSLVLSATLLLFSLVIFFIITSNFHYMWDFKLYYWGTVAYMQGLNPLDTESLRQVISGGQERSIFSVGVLEVGREFALIPTVFQFYEIFVPLGIERLYDTFLVVKLIALNALFFVWFRYVLPYRLFTTSTYPVLTGLCVALVTMLSWNRTLFLDIEAGNVSIFEQLFIWIGVAFYLRQRFYLFALFIAISSLWKLVPLVFLFLLLPLFLDRESRKKGIAALGIGSGIFLSVHFLSFLVEPENYRYFISALLRFSDEERGIFNPCIIAVIGDFWDFLSEKELVGVGNAAVKIYALYAGMLSALLVTCFMVLKRTGLWKDPVKFVMFTFLVFALVSPRFKDYSYILLIVPTLYILLCGKGRIEERVMLFIFVTCPPVFAYYSYFVIWGTFLFFLWQEELLFSKALNSGKVAPPKAISRKS